MKKRLIGVLAFALAVSAGAAFVLYQLIASKMTVGAAPKAPTTKVLVAAHDLPLGALIQERDVVPQDYLTVPAGAIVKKEDIVGRGVTTPIHQDAPFYEAALAPKGAGAGFASTIPSGMRAFAVHVNEVVGVAGFAVAGMRVDVLVAGTPPGSTENVGSITRTLLQNVQVLSAGQNYQKDAEGKPVLVQVVNLLVTPEQAEILNLATQLTIQLVLRNPTDKVIVTTPGASTLNLFAGGKFHAPRAEVESNRPAPVIYRPAIVAPKPAGPPQMVTIEVFEGSKKIESRFRNPEAGMNPDTPGTPGAASYAEPFGPAVQSAVSTVPPEVKP
jgi:pilus assembly protein CpaB